MRYKGREGFPTMLHCNFGMKGFFLVEGVLGRMLGSLGGAQGGLYGLVTEGGCGTCGTAVKLVRIGFDRLK